jgi:hypothetical protein
MTQEGQRDGDRRPLPPDADAGGEGAPVSSTRRSAARGRRSSSSWSIPSPWTGCRSGASALPPCRRCAGLPMSQDAKLNSHSKLNCVIACLQAEQAGADEALMLDPHGFVNTTNACNFFIVRKGEVWTSTGDYCMNGVTRQKVIELAGRTASRCSRRTIRSTRPMARMRPSSPARSARRPRWRDRRQAHRRRLEARDATYPRALCSPCAGPRGAGEVRQLRRIKARSGYRRAPGRAGRATSSAPRPPSRPRQSREGRRGRNG